MAQADLIPAGRTSRIVRGSTELQIQTEYAYRPNPRLTTSIISKGQTIQKIQQDLASPVVTIEEKNKVEDLLRKQHLEVLNIIGNKEISADLTIRDKPTLETTSLSLCDRLAGIEGVEKVFRIDNDGNFETQNVSEEFKNVFAAVFKSLHEILDIFSQLPGGKREEGVCELEPDRLYFASCGYECFFILARPINDEIDIEKLIQAELKE
jgi:hypothetical protein